MDTSKLVGMPVYWIAIERKNKKNVLSRVAEDQNSVRLAFKAADGIIHIRLVTEWGAYGYEIDPEQIGGYPFILWDTYDAVTGTSCMREYGETYYNALVVGGPYEVAAALVRRTFHQKLVETGKEERERYTRLLKHWPTK